MQAPQRQDTDIAGTSLFADSTCLAASLHPHVGHLTLIDLWMRNCISAMSTARLGVVGWSIRFEPASWTPTRLPLSACPSVTARPVTTAVGIMNIKPNPMVMAVDSSDLPRPPIDKMIATQLAAKLTQDTTATCTPMAAAAKDRKTINATGPHTFINLSSTFFRSLQFTQELRLIGDRSWRRIQSVDATH